MGMRWQPEFTLEEVEKENRGTDIVLHLNEESQEFLEADRVGSVLEKFCRFLPIPIFFEDKQINNPTPAWTKKPAELTTEDYQGFYKELYPFWRTTAVLDTPECRLSVQPYRYFIFP